MCTPQVRQPLPCVSTKPSPRWRCDYPERSAVCLSLPVTPCVKGLWKKASSLCGYEHLLSESHCVISSLFRALADILRQQGPIPIAHCERETISAIDTSPKENTPVRSSSTNHYTPMRTAKQTPGKWEPTALSLLRLVRGFSDISATMGQIVKRLAVSNSGRQSGLWKRLGTVPLGGVGM